MTFKQVLGSGLRAGLWGIPLDQRIRPENKPKAWHAAHGRVAAPRPRGPGRRTQVLSQASRNRPRPRLAGSPPRRPPCPAPKPGGSEAPESGERRHFRRRWRRQPIPALEAGGAGSPGSRCRAAPAAGLGGSGGPGRPPPPCCTVPVAASFPAGPARRRCRRRGEAHLLAEALDLGLGQLLALVQLLDPLVQLLGEHLLVHDATRPNRLPLRATPAPPPAHGPHAHAAAGSRGTCVAAGGCWRLPGAGANPRTLPAVPGRRPLPSSARSSPGAPLSVMAAAGVVTSRPASGGGGVEGPGQELRNCRANRVGRGRRRGGGRGAGSGAKAQAQRDGRLLRRLRS